MAGELKTVFRFGTRALELGVPPSFAGLPFVIDEDGQPDVRLNTYLLARRNGDWSAGGAVALHAVLSGRRVARAKLNTLQNRAYQLDVFRRWCRSESLDLSNVEDSDLEAFAAALEEGAITGFSGGLQSASVNQYLTSAIDLLRFGSATGWRGQLVLAMRRTRREGRKLGQVPMVMRRLDPAAIESWYTRTEIERFLEAFETAPVKLAARVMAKMGLRLFETLALRPDDFPTIEEYRRDRAKRSIRVRGKFDKVRRVPLGEDILMAVQSFCKFERLRLARTLREPTELLLIGASNGGRSTGPLSSRVVQKAFVVAREEAGFSALTPHLLRHHYAAHFLLEAWERRAALTNHSPRAYTVGQGSDLLSNDLIALKQSLGHASLETTMRYLYAISYLLGSEIPQTYSDELDGDQP